MKKKNGIVVFRRFLTKKNWNSFCLIGRVHNFDVEMYVNLEILYRSDIQVQLEVVSVYKASFTCGGKMYC